MARLWDHWMTFIQFIIAIMMGVAYNSGMSQTLVLLFLILFHLLLTLVVRPWKSNLLNALELIALFFIFIVTILLVIIAAYDQRKCFICAD